MTSDLCFRKIYKAPCGKLLLEVTESKLSRCSWGIYTSEDTIISPNNPYDIDVMKAVTAQLDEYFDGSRMEFDLPVQITGTEFQHRVWKCLMGIPYGTKLNYSEIASHCGCKGGQRAVAQACGSNPLNVIIPCHRVVRSDGSLGGYTVTTSGKNKGAQASGLYIKQYLLNLEKNNRTTLLT